MALSNGNKTSKVGRLTRSSANSPADIDGGAFIKFGKTKVVYLNTNSIPTLNTIIILIDTKFIGNK